MQDEIEITSEDKEQTKALAERLQGECKLMILTKTPREFIRKRQGRGGLTFDYVEGGYVELVLNNQFQGNWSFEVVSDKQVEDQIIVLGKLTTYRKFGNQILQLPKMQYGSSAVKKTQDGKIIDLADDYKAAATDSLKKCASLLGIAFDIYHPKVDRAIKEFIKEVPEKK